MVLSLGLEAHLVLFDDEEERQKIVDQKVQETNIQIVFYFCGLFV